MKREKERKKSNWKIWVPIICIVVVGITFFLIHDMQNKIEEMEISNTTSSETNEMEKNNGVVEENTIEENTIAENEIENELTNSAENKNASNTVKNTAVNQTVNQSSAPAQPGVTDQKQKAIELVKKEWGEDDSVNYVFDYVNENGEYVIAVKDKASATVKYYFRVNLETETVELD